MVPTTRLESGAARVLIACLAFELVLVRITGGPQPLLHAGLDAAALLPLAWLAERATRRGRNAAGLRSVAPAAAIAAGIAFLIAFLTLRTLHHERTLPAALLAALGTAVLLVAGHAFAGRRHLVALACVSWLATCAMLWELRAGEIPWSLAGGLAAWCLVLAALVNGRAWLAAPVAAIVLACLPLRIRGPAPVVWSAAGDVPAGPDIVLLVADTLRADHAPRLQTLRRLGADAHDFGSAQAASSWTLPSMASLMTSRPVAEHGAISNEARVKTSMRRDVDTLAELLARAGYDTAAVLADNPYVGPAFGFERGFAYFDFDGSESHRFDLPLAVFTSARPLVVGLVFASFRSLDMAWAKRLLDYGAGDDASALVDRVDRVLQSRRERPLFLWVHAMDLHLPYRHAASLPGVDDALRGALTRITVGELRNDSVWRSDERRRILRQAYAAELEHVDAAWQHLLDALGPAPARGRVVVLTSDHGEEFFEHGGFEHGHSFHQEIVTVPLVIAGLPDPSSLSQAAPVSLLDVAPTLLAAAGVPVPSSLRGRNLATPVAERNLTAANLLYADDAERVGSFAVRRGRWKLIEHRGVSLFDLAVDPGERRDVSASHPGWVRALRQARPRSVPTGAPAKLDPKARERLRALGYLE